MRKNKQFNRPLNLPANNFKKINYFRIIKLKDIFKYLMI
jgi:hypothetical protein